MGKRELVIVLAFIIAGAIAFQFSAPPAKETGRGFSFAKLIDSARREMRGNQSHAAPPRTMVYRTGPDVTELRFIGTLGPIRVQGEARADVTLELTVSSTGADQTQAVAIANKTTVKEDRVGGVLTLKLQFPPEERQTSLAVLKVPERLALRFEGTRDATISRVRAVDLGGAARGTTQIDHVAGLVRGEQNGGTLTLAAVQSVKMTLTRTRARIGDITGAMSLDVRDGDTEIRDSRGALEIEERRGDISVRAHTGTITISGTDGQIRIEAATAEVRLDLRRAQIEAELAAGVAGSLVTSDEELRVTWSDPAGVLVDAVATNGAIDASAWNLVPVKTPAENRIDAALGTRSTGAPRVSLRNQGANIVLKKSSKK